MTEWAKTLVSWMLCFAMVLGNIGPDLQYVRAAEEPSTLTLLYKGNPITPGMEIPYGTPISNFSVKGASTVNPEIKKSNLKEDTSESLGENITLEPSEELYVLGVQDGSESWDSELATIKVVPARLAAPTGVTWGTTTLDGIQESEVTWTAPSTTEDGYPLPAGVISDYTVTLVKKNDDAGGGNQIVESDTKTELSEIYKMVTLSGHGEGKYLADVQANVTSEHRNHFTTSSIGASKDVYLVKLKLEKQAGVLAAGFGDSTDTAFFMSENPSLTQTITATVDEGYAFGGWSIAAGSCLELSDSLALTTTVKLKPGLGAYNTVETITAQATDNSLPTISEYTNTETQLKAVAKDAQSGLAKGVFSTIENATNEADVTGWSSVSDATPNGDGSYTFLWTPTTPGTYYFYALDASGNIKRSESGITVTKVQYEAFYKDSILVSPYIRYYFGTTDIALETPVRKGYEFDGFKKDDTAITAITGEQIGTELTVTAQWSEKSHEMTFTGGVSSVSRPYSGKSTVIEVTTNAEYDSILWRWEKKQEDETWAPVSGELVSANKLTVSQVADSGVYHAIASITVNSRPTPTVEEISSEVDVSITPVMLTITPQEYRITYGDVAPEYAYSIQGYVNNENAAAAGVMVVNTEENKAITCDYTPWDSVVGKYEISAHEEKFSAPNYAFQASTTPAYLTVEAYDISQKGAAISLTLTTDGTTPVVTDTYSYKKGEAKTPTITVTDTRNSSDITSYFTPSYENNEMAGTGAKAIVTATDDTRYTGSTYVTFAIQAAEFAAHTVIDGTTTSEEKPAWVYGEKGVADIAIDSVYGDSSQETIKSFDKAGCTVTYYVKRRPRLVDGSFGAEQAEELWDTNVLLDAGMYSARAHISSPSFAEIWTAPVEFVVLPKELYLTSESSNKTYDGNPLTNSTCGIYGAETLVGTDSFTYIKTTGTITNVGLISNAIDYRFSSATNAGNYKVDATTHAGTLEITQATLVPPSTYSWSLSSAQAGSAAWVQVQKANVNVTYELVLYRVEKNGTYTMIQNPDYDAEEEYGVGAEVGGVPVEKKYIYRTSTNPSGHACDYDFTAAILADMQRNDAIGLTETPEAYVYKIRAISDNANYTSSVFSSAYSVPKKTAILQVNKAVDSGVTSITVTNPKTKVVKDASDQDITLYYLFGGQSIPIVASLESGYSVDEESGVWTIAPESGCTIGNKMLLSTTLSTAGLSECQNLTLTARAKDDAPVIDSITAVTDNLAVTPSTTLTLRAHDTRAIKAYAFTTSATAPAQGDSAWNLVDAPSIEKTYQVPITHFGEMDTLAYYAHIKDITTGNVVTSAPIYLYKISFLNGEDSEITVTGSMDPIMKAQNEDITLPHLGFSTNGFSFKNWHSSMGSVYVDQGIYTENKGAELTATWTDIKHTYTVKYHYQQTDGDYSNNGKDVVVLSAAENASVPSEDYLTLTVPTGLEYDHTKTKIDGVLCEGSDTFTMGTADGRTIDVYFNRHKWELKYQYEILDETGKRVGDYHTQSSYSYFYDEAVTVDDSAIKTAILDANPGYDAGGWSFSVTGTKPETMPDQMIVATISLQPKSTEYEVRYWFEELKGTAQTVDATHVIVDGKYYALDSSLSEKFGGKHNEEISVGLSLAKDWTGFTKEGYKSGLSVDSSAPQKADGKVVVSYTDKLYVNYFFTRNSYTVTSNVWYEDRTAENRLKTKEFGPFQYEEPIPASDFAEYFNVTEKAWLDEAEMVEKLNGHYLASYADWSTGDAPTKMPASNIVVNRDYVKKQDTVKYYLEVFIERDLLEEYGYPDKPNYKFAYYAPEGTDITIVDGTNKKVTDGTKIGYTSLSSLIYGLFQNYRFVGEWNDSRDDYEALGVSKPADLVKDVNRNTNNKLSIHVSESHEDDEDNTLRIYFERKVMDMEINYYYNANEGEAADNTKLGTLKYARKWNSHIPLPIYATLLFDGVNKLEEKKNGTLIKDEIYFNTLNWGDTWDALRWSMDSKLPDEAKNIDFRNQNYVVSYSGNYYAYNEKSKGTVRTWLRSTFTTYEKEGEAKDYLKGGTTSYPMGHWTDWWNNTSYGTKIDVYYTLLKEETYYVEPKYYTALHYSGNDNKQHKIGESTSKTDYQIVKVPYDDVELIPRMVNQKDIYDYGFDKRSGYVHSDEYPGADTLKENKVATTGETLTVRSDFGTKVEWDTLKKGEVDASKYAVITLQATVSSSLCSKEYLVKHLEEGFVVYEPWHEDRFVKGNNVSKSFSNADKNSPLGKLVYDSLNALMTKYKADHQAEEEKQVTVEGENFDPRYDYMQISHSGFSTPNMTKNGVDIFYFEHTSIPYVTYTINGLNNYTFTPKKGGNYTIGAHKDIPAQAPGYVLGWYYDSAYTNPIPADKMCVDWDGANHTYYGLKERNEIDAISNVYYELANGTSRNENLKYLTRNDIEKREDGKYYLKDGSDEEVACKVTSLPSVPFKNGKGQSTSYEPEVHTYSYKGEVIWIETYRKILSFTEASMESGKENSIDNYKDSQYQKAGFTCDDKNENTVMAGYGLADPVYLEVFYARNTHKITVLAGEGDTDFVPYNLLKGVGSRYTLPEVTRNGYALSGWIVYEDYDEAGGTKTEITTEERKTALQFTYKNGVLVSFAMPESDVAVKPIWSPASLGNLITYHYYMNTKGAYELERIEDIFGATKTEANSKFYLDEETTPGECTVYYDNADSEKVIGASTTGGDSVYYYKVDTLDNGEVHVKQSDLIAQRVSHADVASEQVLTLKDYRLDTTEDDRKRFQLEKVAYRGGKGELTTFTNTAVKAGATKSAEYGMTLTYYYVRQKYELTLTKVAETGGEAGFSAVGAADYYYGETVNAVAKMSHGYDFLGWFVGETQKTAADVLTYTFDMPANALEVIGKSKPNLHVLDTVTLVNGKEGDYVYGYKDAIGNILSVSLNGLNPAAQVTKYQWYEVAENGEKTLISGATSAIYHFPVGKNAGTYRYQCDVTLMRTDNQNTVTKESDVLEVCVQKASMNPQVKSYSAAYDGLEHSITVTVGANGDGYTAYYSTTEITAENFDSVEKQTGAIRYKDVIREGNVESGAVAARTVYFYLQSTNPNYKDASGSGTIKITPVTLHVSAGAGSYSKVYDGTPYLDMDSEGKEVEASLTDDTSMKYKIAKNTYLSVQGIVEEDKKADAVGTVLIDFHGEFNSRHAHDATMLSMTNLKAVLVFKEGDKTVERENYFNYIIASSSTSLDLTATITPKEITAVWDSTTTFPYDHTPHIPSVSVAESDIAIADRGHISMVATGAQTNAADYSANAQIAITGEDCRSDDYKIMTSSCDFSIVKMPLQITPVSKTVTYNGENHELDIYKIVAGTAPSTIDYTKEDGSVDETTVPFWSTFILSSKDETGKYFEKEQGVYTVTPIASTFRVKDKDGKDITENYEVTYNPGTLTINKRKIWVTSGIVAAGKLYDGNDEASLDVSEVQFATAAIVEGTPVGLVDGETLTLNPEKVQGRFENANVGTDKTVHISFLEGALVGPTAANYELLEVPVTGSVSAPETIKAQISSSELQVSLDNMTVYYGQPVELKTIYKQKKGATITDLPDGPAVGDVTGSFQYQIKNGDDVVVESYTPGDAIDLEPGNYAVFVKVGTATSENYTIVCSSDAGVLMVQKRPITVKPAGTITKTYDGTVQALPTIKEGAADASGKTPIKSEYYTFAIPTAADGLSFGSALYGSDTLGIAVSSALYSTEGGATVHVGTDKAVNLAGLMLTGERANYYRLVTDASLTSDMTQLVEVGEITKAPLTITAEDKKITYGAEAPTYTWKYDGFQNGETGETPITSGGASFKDVIACTGTYVQVAENGVGNYTITPTWKPGTTAESITDYEVTFTPGTLTVDPAKVTITAENKNTEYGASPLPTNSVSYEGVQYGQDMTALLTAANGDSADFVSYGYCAWDATATEADPGKVTTLTPAGNYAIWPKLKEGVSLLNYEFEYAKGQLTVTQKQFTVTVIGVADKTYDGTNIVNKSNVTLRITNLLKSDVDYLVGTKNVATRVDDQTIEMTAEQAEASGIAITAAYPGKDVVWNDEKTEVQEQTVTITAAMKEPSSDLYLTVRYKLEQEMISTTASSKIQPATLTIKASADFSSTEKGQIKYGTELDGYVNYSFVGLQGTDKINGTVTKTVTDYTPASGVSRSNLAVTGAIEGTLSYDTTYMHTNKDSSAVQEGYTVNAKTGTTPLWGDNYSIAFATNSFDVVPNTLMPTVAWDGSTIGKVVWDQGDVPSIGYAEGKVTVARYEIALTKNGGSDNLIPEGERVVSSFTTKEARSKNLADIIRSSGSGTYTFSVKAVPTATGSGEINENQKNVVEGTASTEGRKASKITLTLADDTDTRLSGNQVTLASTTDATEVSYVVLQGETLPAASVTLDGTGYMTKSITATSDGEKLSAVFGAEPSATEVKTNQKYTRPITLSWSAADAITGTDCTVTVAAKKRPATLNLTLAPTAEGRDTAMFKYNTASAPQFVVTASPESDDTVTDTGYTYSYSWEMKKPGSNYDVTIGDATITDANIKTVGAKSTLTIPEGLRVQKSGNYNVRVTVTATRADNGETTSAFTTAIFAITPLVIADHSVETSISGWTYGEIRKTPSSASNPGSAQETIYYRAKQSGDTELVDKAAYSDWILWDETYRPTEAGDYMTYIQVAATDDYETFYTKIAEFTIAPKKLDAPTNLKFGPSTTSPIGLITWDQVSTIQENSGTEGDTASKVVPAYQVELFFVPDTAGESAASDLISAIESRTVTETQRTDWRKYSGTVSDSATPSVDLSETMRGITDSGKYVLCIVAKPTDGNNLASANGLESVPATHLLQAATGAKLSATATSIVYNKDGITLEAKTSGDVHFNDAATYVWHHGTGSEASVDKLAETGRTITVKNVADSGYYTCEVKLDGQTYYTETKQITITSRQIAILPDSATKVYDGTPLTKTTYTFRDISDSNKDYTNQTSGTGFILPSTGDTITATIAGSITYYDEAGATGGVMSNQVTACTMALDGQDKKANYEFTLTANKGSLTLTKRPITIKAADDSKAYDGAALTHAGLTGTDKLGKISDATNGVTDKGLVNGDKFTDITLAGTVTNVGTADNTPSSVVIYTSDGTREVTCCYEPSYSKGTLEVTKQTQTITATATSRVYDNVPATISHDTNALQKDQTKTVTYYYATLAKDGAGNITGVTCGAEIGTTAPVNVGDYCIKVRYGGNANYEAAESGFVGYQITKATQTITAPAETALYNGTEQGYSKAGVAGVTGGSATGAISVTYKDASGAAVTMPKNVGTYTVTVSVAATDNYAANSENTTFTIEKRKITIETLSATKTYDKTPLTQNGWKATTYDASGAVAKVHTPTTGAVSVGICNNDSAVEDTLTISITGSVTNVADTSTGNNSFSVVSFLNGAGEDVTKNYDISYTNGTLKVTRKPISDGTVTVENIADQTYTGVAITPSVVVKDGEDVLTLADYSLSYTENVDAGTATITIVGTGNYDSSRTKTFKILQRVIKVRPKNQTSIPYDATTHQVSGVENLEIIEGTLAEGQSITTVSYTGSIMDAGTVTIGIVSDSVIIKRNTDGADLTKNYIVNLETNTLTVTKVDSTIHVPVVGTVDVDYNGTPHSFSGATVTGVTGGTSPSALTYYYSKTGEAETTVAPTHAGTYRVRIVSAESTNYNTVEETTTWVIRQASITLTGTRAESVASKEQAPAYHVYEQALAEVGTYVTGTIYSGDEVSLDIQTKRYYVGSTEEVTVTSLPGTYRIVPVYNTDNTDYAVTIVEGVYNIWNKDMNYGITPNNREYDGTSKDSVTTVVINPPEGAKVYYSLTESLTAENYSTAGSLIIPKLTDAGTYTVYYCIVADHFNAETGSETVTISAKAISITGQVVGEAETAESIYLRGLKDVTSVVTTGSICDGDDLLLGARIEDSTDAVMTDSAAVGTYRIVPTYDTSNTNYIVSTIEGSYEVKPETLDFMVEAYKEPYDALSHEVVHMDFTKPAAGNGNVVSIYYADTEITSETTLTPAMLTVPQITEVGTKTVYYYIVTKDANDNANYLPKAGSFTAEVTKADTMLTLLAQQKDFTGVGVAYDGHTVAGVTGGHETGAVTITYQKQGSTFCSEITPVSAGVYDVEVSVAGTDTYNGVTKKTTLTIRKIADVVEVGDDLSKVFDGRPVKEPVLITRNGDGALRFVYYDETKKELPDGAVPTNVGTYYVKVVSEEGTNYLEQSSDYKPFTITRAQQMISAEDKTVVYNGEEQEIQAKAKENPSFTYLYQDVEETLPVTTKKPVKPGVYRVVISSEETQNYLASTEENKKVVTLTIEKAPITLAADSAEHTYNGKKLTKDTYKVVEGSLGTGDEITEVSMTVDSVITEVGSVANEIETVAIRNAEEEVTGYYIITLKKGTLTVLPVAYELTITKDLSKPFDGIPVEMLTKDAVEGLDDLNPATPTFVYYRTGEDGTHTELEELPTEAGNYAVRAFAEASTNYKAASSAFKEFAIEPLEDKVVIVKTLSKQKDGKPVALTDKDVTRLGTGELTFVYYTLKDEVYTELETAPSEVGVYYVKAFEAKHGNYKAAESDYVKFEISQFAISITGKPGQEVKVSIQTGVDTIAWVKGIVGPDGIYVAVFEPQPDGIYNIVVETSEYKETRGMTISGGAIQGAKTTTFEVPGQEDGTTNSYVEMKKDHKVGIAVTGLHDLFQNPAIYAPEDQNIVEAKGSVDIVLLLDKLEERETSKQIQDLLLKDGKTAVYTMDISLEKRVKLANSDEYRHESYIRDTTADNILEICVPLPERLLGRTDLTVYRRHVDENNPSSDKLEAMKDLGQRAEQVANGTYPEEGFVIVGDYAFIYSHLFSEYVIAGDEDHQPEESTQEGTGKQEGIPEQNPEHFMSPKTKDDLNFWAWVLTMIVSGMSLAGLGTWRKRRKKDSY